MGKKGVPEWLNSSLWSSKPYTDCPPIYASEPAKPESPPRQRSPPPPQPPPPQPPPSPPKLEPPASFQGDPGSPKFSPEEISRQSQILSELLLQYLPNDRAFWPHELEKKRSQYKSFKDELLQNPSDITRRMEEAAHVKHAVLNDESRALLHRSEITHGEHPLSLGSTSVWNQFFQEAEIIEQIERDVKRTHPEMQFFAGDSCFAKTNQESLKRILIVFAKLNPGIRYVQGMNEVLAPLFYVFRNDPEENNVAHVEADTFFCFVELLSGFRDNFCKQLDNSVVGIRSTITKLSLLLKKHDEELWRHLDVTTKVNPHFYAFRWITLLLSQEFEFSDCLSIWDTILSDPEGPQETLLRICCAMLILVRRRLLAGDFTANLKLLQHYPATNIGHLLYVANKLRGPVPD
ncbi:hypothetical protein KFK09_025004 [Dendrobium nobile]|uniref:Rab-GAP TBC domain-containing protein n=1 Tax=Dendrobium nobile TaxID=94219 RepID=A0A8T3AFC3_DENNO|nr:hypothetical protein KFK09_025004 [Dendrobium nobile]